MNWCWLRITSCAGRGCIADRGTRPAGRACAGRPGWRPGGGLAAAWAAAWVVGLAVASADSAAVVWAGQQGAGVVIDAQGVLKMQMVPDPGGLEGQADRRSRR